MRIERCEICLQRSKGFGEIHAKGAKVDRQSDPLVWDLLTLYEDVRGWAGPTRRDSELIAD